MLEELCDSAVEVGRELAKLAGGERRWRNIIKNMLHAWDRGMQDVRNPNSTVSLAPVIKKAGFSDYDKPAPAPRTAESLLLAKRRSSRRAPHPLPPLEAALATQAGSFRMLAPQHSKQTQRPRSEQGQRCRLGYGATVDVAI